jgi:hypothetical protein
LLYRRHNASIKELRRLLAISLLALLCLPFASAIFAPTALNSSSLPACCRRDGTHHCMTDAMERRDQPSSNAHIHAPVEKCPYCPVAVATIHGATHFPPAARSIFAALVNHPAHTAQVESKLRITESRSRQKRGPPNFFSL